MTDSLFPADHYTCPHAQSSLGRSLNADGTERVWNRCDECGENTGGAGVWIAHQDVGSALEALPVFDSYKPERPPCVRCGRFGTQLHHFMPVRCFGRVEADLWPTAWLCPDCHGRWHQTVEAKVG